MTTRKAIFVTGGGSGIGRAIAVRFASEGWFVGLGDRNAAGMAETAALLPAGRSCSQVFDVADRQAWDAALAAVAEASCGRIDAVANNAGISLGGPLEEYEQDEIDRILDVNLKGVIYGAQASYPWLKAAGPGSCLIYTASAAALFGKANQSLYGACKAGVRSLTESLDAEWAPDGIRVRSLMPSFIDTPLLQNTPNRKRNSQIREVVVATGLEFTPVEEVAEAAWRAVTSDAVHHLVGKSARRMRLLAKWAPGLLRKRARLIAEAHERVGRE